MNGAVVLAFQLYYHCTRVRPRHIPCVPMHLSGPHSTLGPREVV